MTGSATLAEVRALEDDLRASGEFSPWWARRRPSTSPPRQLAVAPDLITAATERDAAAAAAAARADAAADGLTPAEQEQAAAAAEAALRAERDELVTGELTRLTAAGEQSLDNPAFVDFLLFGPDGEIRPAMGDNLDDGHAPHRRAPPATPRSTTRPVASTWSTTSSPATRAPGAQVLASGPPVPLAEINDYLRGGMATLGALAVGVMALLLLFSSGSGGGCLPVVVAVGRGRLRRRRPGGASAHPGHDLRASRSCSGSASTSPSRCTTATRRSAPRAAPSRRRPTRPCGTWARR